MTTGFRDVVHPELGIPDVYDPDWEDPGAEYYSHGYYVVFYADGNYDNMLYEHPAY